METVLRRVGPLGSGVQLHPGRFPASCPDAVRQERFAFVHLDADLYESTRSGLEVFYPLVVPGGYVVVRDYNAWPGARQATDEFFRDKPGTPTPMPDQCGSAVVAKAPEAARTTR